MYKKIIPVILFSALVFILLILVFLSTDKKPETNTDRIFECQGCNLVVISLTNTRKDHIGIYGYERDTTPYIDEFFKNSLIFKNAFTHASWTLPSTVSFFTSLFPYSHGVMQRESGYKINEEILTLAEVLKEGGYATAAFTGDGDYNRRFNINKGFDLYLDNTTYADFNVTFQQQDGRSGTYFLPISSVIPIATDWLAENKNKQFFMFLQGFDTHCPFTPEYPFDTKFYVGYKGSVDFSKCLWTFDKTEPQIKNGKKYWEVKTEFLPNGQFETVVLDEKDVKKMISLYDGEIAQADNYLRTLFEEFGRLRLEKKTIFIFMSEHGDLFGEHGRFMRGGPLRGTFYDPVINFPLLIKHPNISEPVFVDDLIQMVDLMPTLLTALGIEDSQARIRQGKKISLTLFGDEETNKYVYAGSVYKGNDIFFSGISVIESIRDKKWKLIREKIYTEDSQDQEYYELYDIEKDPQELYNLYEAEKDVASRLLRVLEEWSRRVSQ